MHFFVEQIYRNNKNYKAIAFLDRDGTINEEVNYLHYKKQLDLLPHVSDGIRFLNQKSIAAVVVTNQPVVARGLIGIEELKEINNTLVEKLKNEGAYIDAIYSCPHHPEKNHPDIPAFAMKYRIACTCRKPNIAMFNKALSRFGNKKILGVIGDQTRDILAGKNLNSTTILVNTGLRGEDKKYQVTPDFIARDVLQAVEIMIRNYGE